MKLRSAWLVCALTAVCLTGCSKGLEGTWRATKTQGGASADISMTFSKDKTFRQKTSITSGNQPLSFETTGTWKSDKKNITITPTGSTMNGKAMPVTSATEATLPYTLDKDKLTITGERGGGSLTLTRENK